MFISFNKVFQKDIEQKIDALCVVFFMYRNHKINKKNF